MSQENQVASTENTTNRRSNRGSVVVAIRDLFNKLSNDTTQSKPKIFKVDDRLRKVNAEDYEPKIVAIGPIIHPREAHLQAMEQHKLRYLQQLLQSKDDLTLEALVDKVREIEEMALHCYSTPLNVDADEFVKILVIDGCFIIELVRRHKKVAEHEHVSAKTDPILEPKSLSLIRHDLMLFENQLPFSVLNHLFNIIKTHHPNENLYHLVKCLVMGTLPWRDVVPKHYQSSKEPDHLLGLIYQCITPFSPSSKTPSIGEHRNSLARIINSASELKKAGIHLQGSENNLLTFNDGGLKIPHLQVSGETESLLRNLMAYEQLCLDDDHPKHVIDYVFFMNCLIRSTNDIEILRRSKIISNYLGGDDNICLMFDRLGTNFLIRSSNFCYSDVFASLNRHCSVRQNQWMEKLKRDYFNSPWSVIKFFAASLLLLLTSTQTVFAILAYFYKK